MRLKKVANHSYTYLQTSLANVIASCCRQSTRKTYRYFEISASMSNTSEIKGLIKTASNDLSFGFSTIVFVDEIHRFSKSQQDIFLSCLETGTITLIGATTENPSLSMSAALISRCHILPLRKLTTNNVITILERSVQALNGLVCDKSQSLNLTKKSANVEFSIDSTALNWLAESCDGDARIALGGLELAIKSKRGSIKQSIDLEDVRNNLKKSHMTYDRNGDEHYNIISALHKSVRASNENAALYWLSRLIFAGEDPLYISRRLVRMASEDVGMADSKALVLAVNTMNTCKLVGLPACEASLVRCTIYLSRASKSRAIEDSLRLAQKKLNAQ